MSLQFLDICQLFEQLSSLKSPESRELNLQEWFKQHQSSIQRRGAPALALLSCLFPEKRADRVYALRTKQLEHMVTKAACLGHSRVSELRRLQGRNGIDFASAAQQVLSATDDFSNPPRSLTVEEVDHTLDRLASTCVFPSPKLQGSITIGYIEAFDELLPVSPPPNLERSLKESARAEIEPCFGTMIGLQELGKTRSIQHCCQLASHKEVSVQRKYDGEYCQIHISRTHSQHHITIFSKNGRDSTMDRVGVHNTIK
ncbi:uncharacterized protein PV07_12564 [Cladophialophora immunda]|uniref:DNA ligase ATP-dependent N-terminal domain-containing protein n=1 Tax=Cladophialophora immunda TaxID=569365 RepID=A0A0D2ABC1_9EURO|nr:uncharacterized protein PV07_12564 [Cladophialophora immunda]KIW22037.1 hypothetical protein PV07_12564 [Cladophialophora immunda]